MATESPVETNRCGAVSFGIYSASDFVRPDEAHTYELFCHRFKKDLRPQGALEQTLAAEIIHAAWRLRRCCVAESQMQPDPATQIDNEIEDPLLSRTQTLIDRARAQAQRQLLSASKELRRLQTERQIRVECLPESFDTQAIGGLTNVKDVKLFLQRVQNQSKLTMADLERLTAPPVEYASTKRTQSDAEPSPPTPRNAACPCGSGDKYKRCCGRNAPPVLHQAA